MNGKENIERYIEAHKTLDKLYDLTDDILLQTEMDSMDQLQAIVTGIYKHHPNDDEVVVINLYHNGTTINLREI